MIKELSFKTKFGWINIREVNERIVSIKFGKKNSYSRQILLDQSKIGTSNIFFSLIHPTGSIS